MIFTFIFVYQALSSNTSISTLLISNNTLGPAGMVQLTPALVRLKLERFYLLPSNPLSYQPKNHVW